MAANKKKLYYLYDVSRILIYGYILSQYILIFYLIEHTGLNFKHQIQILLNSYKITSSNTVTEKYLLMVITWKLVL